MKRGLVIICLLILFACQFGYFVVHTIRQHRLRNEFENKLHASGFPAELLDLVETDANYSQIHWQERGKEFWYNGNLFDVIGIEKKNEKVLIHCLLDRKEKQLLEDFSRSADWSLGSGPGNNNSKYLLNFFETDSPGSSFQYEIVSIHINTLKGILPSIGLLFSPRDVITPPPDADLI